MEVNIKNFKDTKEQIHIIIFISSTVRRLNVLKLKHKEWRTKQKITLKIPIKPECCLIYNSMYRDYKEEI